MKKPVVVVLLLVVLVAGPAFAQLRVNGALGATISFGEETEFGLRPMSGIHYQIPVKQVGLYAGFRAVPVKSGIVLWPNVVVEYGLGSFILEGQLGGGVSFGIGLGDVFKVSAGPVIVPDISGWYPVDKANALRLGAGVLAMVNFKSGVSFMPYLGVKLVVLTP